MLSYKEQMQMLSAKDEDLIVNEVDTDEDLSGLPEEPVNDHLEGIVTTPNDGALNLRVNPDKKAIVLTTIPSGTKLSYKEFSDDWAVVRYNGHEGHCLKKFIK